MAADRTGLTGVGGGHLHPFPTAIRQLVGQHRAERAPVLVEDGPVQPGLLPDMAARLFERARCRGVPHLQCLHNDHAVVLGDGRAFPVEEVLAGVGHPLLYPRHPADGFPAVGRTAFLPGQGTLGLAQRRKFMALPGVGEGSIQWPPCTAATSSRRCSRARL